MLTICINCDTYSALPPDAPDRIRLVTCHRCPDGHTVIND